MKNIIFLILIIIFINGISKGQTCDSIIDVYGKIGESLTLNAHLDIDTTYTNTHWEWNGDTISEDSIYIIDSLSQETGGVYVYVVEYYAAVMDGETRFCFQVYPTESPEENYPENEIIIDMEDMSDSDIAALNGSLDSMGFEKIDSCLCNTLELWAIDAPLPRIVLASTIKEAGDKVDKDGGKSSRNYVVELDVPLYCITDSQYNWESLAPSHSQNSVNVAILDNGFNPALFPNHLLPRIPSFNPCCNNTGNGDPYGYNALDECAAVVPRNHGTIVASVMASFAPDNIPYQMMNIKAMDQRKGSLFKVACAAKHTMRSGADIINLSLGYYGERSLLLDDIVDEAANSGILLIASAGNGGQEKTNHWPSNYSLPIYGKDHVISVGSTSSQGEQADFSSHADIYAPGHNLVSNDVNNVPILKSGTSFSTAFVTAAATVCLSENPNFNPSQVIKMLTDPNLSWSSQESGLLELNVVLIEEEYPIEFSETIIINEPISDSRIFDARISIESTATLLDSADVFMRAGESILFSPGFKCDSGSFLLARIDTCDENSSARLFQNEMEEPEVLVATEDQVSFKDDRAAGSDGLRIVPNPFREQTTISFDLEEAVFLELNIYSSLGQKMKTLARGQYEKGAYQIVFNANDIPPGVYYVNWVKGRVLVTKKIVLQ